MKNRPHHKLGLVFLVPRSRRNLDRAPAVFDAPMGYLEREMVSPASCLIVAPIDAQADAASKLATFQRWYGIVRRRRLWMPRKHKPRRDPTP